MHTQTVTRAIESEVEPDKFYDAIANAGNIPHWAPAFADSIEHTDGTRYRVTKNGESFQVEVLVHPSARAADYLREMAGGKRGGAYIRVMPRPLGGSTVVITVPLAPGVSEPDVANVLEQELTTLTQLVTG